MKTRHTFIPALILAGGLAAGLVLGPSALSQDTRLNEKDLQEMVAKSLPAWDSDILSVKDGPRWSAKIGYAQVLKALADEPLRGDVPRGARRVVDGDRVLRLIPEHGKVRYVNRANTWDANQAGRKLMDKQAAVDLVGKALVDLGLPRAEFGKLRVDTQAGVQASPSNVGDTATHEMYRIVSLTRRAGQWPVLGSRARVAVANNGSVQRLRVNWAPFQLVDGLGVRGRDAVIKQVVDQIMHQDPMPIPQIAGEKNPPAQFLSAQLAYAPQEMTRTYRRKTSGEDSEQPSQQTDRDGDDQTKDAPVSFQTVRKGFTPIQYVPVVLVSVYASPTPYQLVVPLAEAK